MPALHLDLVLADAADENFVLHATACLHVLPGATVHRTADLVVADSGLFCDTFNFICRARMDPAAAARTAAWAISLFGVRPFSWWVGPADRPADLGNSLLAAGLVAAESELAMATDLSLLREIEQSPAGFALRRVASPETLREFAAVSAQNWTPPDVQVTRFYALAERALLDPDCPQRLYLGWLDGIPVATAEVTLSGGLAGVYNISTLAPFRRRGIGTAMTLAPLREARAAGCRRAVLQAAPDGVSLYRRLGFIPFGAITEYKPVPRKGPPPPPG
jgi:ribosomal protein S18 acetylase RimI-like enzyme